MQVPRWPSASPARSSTVALGTPRVATTVGLGTAVTAAQQQAAMRLGASTVAAAYTLSLSLVSRWRKPTTSQQGSIGMRLPACGPRMSRVLHNWKVQTMSKPRADHICAAKNLTFNEQADFFLCCCCPLMAPYACFHITAGCEATKLTGCGHVGFESKNHYATQNGIVGWNDQTCYCSFPHHEAVCCLLLRIPAAAQVVRERRARGQIAHPSCLVRTAAVLCCISNFDRNGFETASRQHATDQQLASVQLGGQEVVVSVEHGGGSTQVTLLDSFQLSHVLIQLRAPQSN